MLETKSPLHSKTLTACALGLGLLVFNHVWAEKIGPMTEDQKGIRDSVMALLLTAAGVSRIGATKKICLPGQKLDVNGKCVDDPQGTAAGLSRKYTPEQFDAMTQNTPSPLPTDTYERTNAKSPSLVDPYGDRCYLDK